MKKGFLILAIALWSIIVVIILSAAVLIAKGGPINMLNTGRLIKNEEILLGNAQNIVIESTRQSLEIRKTSGDNIIVSQYGNPNAKREDLFFVSTSSDKVHIYIESDFKIFNFFNYDERLLVEIPEEYFGNLDAVASSGSIKVENEFTLKNVRLRNTSGSIKINNNITTDALEVKTSSGGIRFNGTVTAKDIYAETSSGSINSTMSINVNEKIMLRCTSGGVHLDDDITAKIIDARTSSGGIRLGDVNVDSYDLRCTSGSIKIDSISGAGDINTSSGGISLALVNPRGDINLSATSGSIKITLEKDLQFTLDAQTNSGGIRTNFAAEKNEKGNHATANIGYNPTVNIYARASSGGIKVEQ